MNIPTRSGSNKMVIAIALAVGIILGLLIGNVLPKSASNQKGEAVSAGDKIIPAQMAGGPCFGYDGNGNYYAGHKENGECAPNLPAGFFEGVSKILSIGGMESIIAQYGGVSLSEKARQMEDSVNALILSERSSSDGMKSLPGGPGYVYKCRWDYWSLNGNHYTWFGTSSVDVTGVYYGGELVINCILLSSGVGNVNPIIVNPDEKDGGASVDVAPPNQ